MIKRYVFWFKTASILQLLTGFFHALSFLHGPLPENDEERHLFDLMYGYKFDLGFGFIRSMVDIMNSLSITFSLFLFFSGLLNLFILKNDLPKKTIKGVILINLFAYSLCLITMMLLTFLPPIVCIALIDISLLIAFCLLLREKVSYEE